MDWLRKTLTLNTALLLAAVSLGAVAYWGVTRYVAVSVANVRETESARFSLTPLVVAARDLPSGFVLDSGVLAVRHMPRAFMPGDAIAADRGVELVGRALRQPVRAGELLVPAVLTPVGKAAFSEQVELGRRAVTVPVDEVSAFDGLLSPGDLVDLMYAHQQLHSRHQLGSAVRVLLEKVPVLATGRATRRTRIAGPDGSSQEVDSSFSTATLSVSPTEAQIITLAQRTGEIVATLRNPLDAAAIALPTLDASALQGVVTASRVRPVSAAGIMLITGGYGGSPRVDRLSSIADRNKPGE
jgi:pilus assembly protein CpaB